MRGLPRLIELCTSEQKKRARGNSRESFRFVRAERVATEVEREGEERRREHHHEHEGLYKYLWHLSLWADCPAEGYPIRPHAYMYGKKLD